MTADTKTRILEAAEQLSSESGGAATSVREIAARAAAPRAAPLTEIVPARVAGLAAPSLTRDAAEAGR